MNKYFYNKGCGKAFLEDDFWERSRKIIQKNNGDFLDREKANKLGIDSFFDDYILRVDINETGDIKPKLKQEFAFFALPYEVDDEFEIEGVMLENFIVSIINKYLTNTIYLASTDSNNCCIVECKKFTSEIFWALDGRYHINTPFIVFDDKKEFFVLLDYDLPIQIIGYKKNIIDDVFAKKYKDLFLDEWSNVLKQYKSYINLIPIAQEYYSFLFPNSKVPKS